MIVLEDQMGRTLSFKQSPQRIVSLVPSQTELLVDLGLRDCIVGLTKFCVHPKDLRKEKTIVGGTKQVNVEKIRTLNPDVILCNKEENTKEIVDTLKAITPVHVSNISTIDDNLSLILQYGMLFHREARARVLVKQIENRFSQFKALTNYQNAKTCAYLIWKNPWMIAGNDTFINHLLEINGYTNHCTQARYPEIKLNDLKDVDYVFLSSEPYPFKEQHIEEVRKHTEANVILVDGEYFSWYGSRLLNAFDYFKILRSQLEL